MTDASPIPNRCCSASTTQAFPGQGSPADAGTHLARRRRIVRPAGQRAAELGWASPLVPEELGGQCFG